MAPLFPESERYSAEVADGKTPHFGSHTGFGMTSVWRTSGVLFPSLREAQLWCEREVRLMEIGELA